MNPHYAAAAIGAAAARRKCPMCGARIRLGKPDSHGRYTCEKCGQKFALKPMVRKAAAR